MRKFRPGVAERLNHYVYRLVDPRNGETFYVGKGTGDRVFDHVNEVPGPLDESEKRKRITSIRSERLEPIHIIHRHGLESEDAAYLVESVLMDAYPGLTNATHGPGATEFGVASADTLEARYTPRRDERASGTGSSAREVGMQDGWARHHSRTDETDEIPLDGPVVTIKITDRVLKERGHDVYETTRSRWIVGPERLMKLRATPHVALAILKMRCIAAYDVPKLGWKVDSTWKGAQPRCSFTGEPASEENRVRYVGKRYPDRSVRRGKARYPSGCKSHPTLVASVGSNQSGLRR